MPSILTVTTAKNVVCTHYKKIFTAIMYIYLSKCHIMSVCRNNLSDCKLDLCISCRLACLSSSLPNKGVSAMEMRSQLDVTTRLQLLLCRKCRVLIQNATQRRYLITYFMKQMLHISDQNQKNQTSGLW